jgi:undecaprenyl-diphosphatase
MDAGDGQGENRFATQEHRMDLQSLDLGTLYFFQTHRLPVLTEGMIGATYLGNTGVFWSAVLLFAIGFLAWGRWRSAVLLTAIAFVSWQVNESVKGLVRRPRPEEGVRPPIPVPHSFSFPSGHAQNAMAVYGTAALLAARGMRRQWAVLLIAAGMAMALLVGTSRLYLGVHYLTDVVGGWIAGLAFALLARWLDELWANQAPTGGSSATECLPK